MDVRHLVPARPLPVILLCISEIVKESKSP